MDVKHVMETIFKKQQSWLGQMSWLYPDVTLVPLSRSSSRIERDQGDASFLGDNRWARDTQVAVHRLQARHLCHQFTYLFCKLTISLNERLFKWVHVPVRKDFLQMLSYE